MTFAQALRQTFFSGTPVAQVAAEMKQLTPEDKKHFHSIMNDAGIACDPPVAA